MSDILCKHGWSRRFCEPCSTAAFIASFKGPGDGGMLAMQQELSALTAENERLRAALLNIENFCEAGLNSPEARHWEAALNDILGITRAALEEKT